MTRFFISLFLVLLVAPTNGAVLRSGAHGDTTANDGSKSNVGWRRWLQFDLDTAWDDLVNTVGSIPEDLGCLALLGISCDEAKCPTVEPLGPANFSMEEYISKSWFIQYYNPENEDEDMSCMTSTFVNITNEQEGDEKVYIQVKNSAMINSVNGTAEGYDDDNTFFNGTGFISELGDSCVQQVEGGEMLINSCAISNTIFYLVAGDYWVLAVAEDYSWAIVSGGPTDEVQVDTLSTTGTILCNTEGGSSFLDIDSAGLLLMTREPQASLGNLTAMIGKLYDLGIYGGDLKTVQHEGCAYPKATVF